MLVLVTGATGFIGRVLCAELARRGHVVRAAVRREIIAPAGVVQTVPVGDLAAETQWERALTDVEAVVHLAARVHRLQAPRSDAQLYFDINARATEALARACVGAGVRRFVLVSSVKVNGESSTDRPFTATDAPDPRDGYGESKLLAERSLARVAGDAHMEWVVVRSPLVYGPGVRANFLRLLSWVDKERPMPFGAVRNARSFVSVWNLCDFLALVLQDATAASRTWMISDGQDVSTADLLALIAHSMHRRVRMVSVPTRLLQAAGALFGRRAEIERLCGSLTVDITPAREELGWSPPWSLQQGLDRTVDWYRSARP